MAIFLNDPEEWQRLDWRILQNGWTSLYYQQSILDKDLEWFKKEGYQVVEFNCLSWTDASHIHNDLERKLNFPDYYGRNWNALNDCLSDLEIKEPGLIIVLRQFHYPAKETAHTLLDIFARNSRLHLLFGERMITLAQVDDPHYQIDPVGACPVTWNGAEWENKNRG